MDQQSESGSDKHDDKHDEEQHVTEEPIFRPAVATGSLGKWKLPEKIAAIAKSGFRAIELCIDDLMAYVEYEAEEINRENVLMVAKQIKKMCDDHEIKIISLTRFDLSNIGDEDKLQTRMAAFCNWLDMTEIFGTNLIVIKAAVALKPNGHTVIHTRRIVHALRKLSAIAAEHRPSMIIAYQNNYASERVHSWQDAHLIIDMVDRTNVVFLPNTFHIACSEWADPTMDFRKVVDTGRDAHA